MADFLPLEITNFDQNASTERGLRTDYLKQVTPLAIEGAKLDASQKKNEYNNDQLSQVADEVSTLDEDQKASAWDQRMQELSNAGVPQARQYIGRYSKELGERVGSIFSGRSGQKASKAQADKLANNPQIMQQAAAMDPASRQKMLSGYNKSVEAFKRVNTPSDLRAEVKLLQDSGIDVGPSLQGLNLNDDSPMGYAHNYNAIAKVLQDREPYRDAMLQAESAQSMGMPGVQTPHKYMNAGNGVVFDETTGKPAYTPPVKDQYEYLSPDKTGGGPGKFNKATGEAAPLTGPDNYADAADRITATEKGDTPDAKNPNSSATGDGQFINKTWLAQARKQIPALKNVPDDQLLDARKFPGLAHDMTVAQVKEDAIGLEKAGQPANMATSAMAYKLGLPDALKVLNAKSDTPLEKILSPAVMKANPKFKGQTAGTYATALKKTFGTDTVGQQPLFGAPKEGEGLPEPDPESQNIMANAGISPLGFWAITGQMSSLPRDQKTRNQALKDMQKWSKDHNVDTSTFASEYKANNEVLQSNISRFNNTRIMEREVRKTIENFKPAADDATIGNVTAANAAAIWGGQETNGPVSMEYKTYLLQLRNELMGYYAALAGRPPSKIDDADRTEAQELIKNGLNSVGAQGLDNAIHKSTIKMGEVLKQSIDDARKDVWTQFGVGENYKPRSGGGGTDRYKVGEIVKGYKFKGGNWRDQKNWVKQNGG